MKSLLYTAFVLCLFLASCEDDDDSKAKEVNRQGSVAVTLSTAHLDSLKDLMTTHYVVWNKGVVVKEFDVKDTIPTLGITSTEGENDNGDTKDMVVPKDYDFFITVK
jgi:hypothetical protein